MKKLFAVFFFMMCIAGPASAQTLVPKETANQYFANCVSAPSSGIMSQQGQQMLCACTAARLTQFFSMEDMQAMMGTDPALARPAYNRMIVNVYAPCMDVPTREYHYKACMENPNTAKLGRHPEGLCSCAADALAQHMKFHGSEIFSKILSRDPNITDPAAALFDDPEFQTLAQQKTIGCLTK